MFKTIVRKIKEVLNKLSLYSDIKDIKNHKDVSVDEKFFTEIEKWKGLYKGYLEEIHDGHRFTIAKGREKVRRHSLRMPKVVSEELATLIYNERVQLTISEVGQVEPEDGSTPKESPLEEFIKDTLKRNKFNTNFPDFLEKMFALGGGVIKPYVNDRNKLCIQFVTADCFLPISYSSSGEVREGVFIAEVFKGDKKYTHLEWHVYDDAAVYTIQHELYKTDKARQTELGIKVDLSELFPDMQHDTFPFPEITQPLFVYVKPNISNNIDINSPLGISVYANAFDTMKSIDIAFDSFIREFRLGKKRILVPQQAIRKVVDPSTGRETQYFDVNDEVYEQYNADMNDKTHITDLSVELRVDEHIAAINALLNLFAMQTGFSAGSFSFDGQSMKTATEVVSENSKTFRTKQHHETVIEDALKHLIQSMIEIAAAFKIEDFTATEYEVNVQFDDSIAQDRTTDSAYYLSMVSGGLMSKLKAMMLQYGYTKEEALEEIEQIKSENQRAQDDAMDMFGMTRSKQPIEEQE